MKEMNTRLGGTLQTAAIFCFKRSLFFVSLTLVLPKYFYLYVTKGVTMTPLWKFVIKHPALIIVVLGDSEDPSLSNHTK